MAQVKKVDAGHYSFLQLIKVMVDVAGPDFAKGALIRSGMSAAARTPELQFGSWQEYLDSIESIANPIAQFEGETRYYGEGIFGLPACPFAESIASYKSVADSLPEEHGKITEALNRNSKITMTLRVGEGAAVSPFCAVHQPIRSELGARIRIGPQTLRVLQLGCRSGSGTKGIATLWCEAAGVDPEQVASILDDNMCCYCVRLEAEGHTSNPT